MVGEGADKDPRLIYSCTCTNKFIVKSISFHNPKSGISISWGVGILKSTLHMLITIVGLTVSIELNLVFVGIIGGLFSMCGLLELLQFLWNLHPL